MAGRLRRAIAFDPRNYVVYLGFLAIFVSFTVTLGQYGFATVRNLSNIVLQTAPATVLAVGVVFVLSAGEIDLSFGSIVAVAALAASVIMGEQPMALGTIAGLDAGILIGLLNGALVAYVRLPSFLVTLATLGLFAGVARSMTNLRSIPVTNDAFTGFFGSGSLAGIPSRVLWTAAVVATGHFVYRETRLGAHVLATGDNPRAAEGGRHQRAARAPDRAGHKRRLRRARRAAVRGPAAGGEVHARRERPDDRARCRHRRRHAALRRQGLGRRRAGRVAAHGHAEQRLILMGLSASEQMIVRGLIILGAVAVSLRETNR